MIRILTLALTLAVTGLAGDGRAESGPTTPAAAGQAVAAGPLRVCVIRGLWYDLYAFDRAFARLGGVRASTVWHVSGGLSGTVPSSADALAAFDLVVVANVNGQALGAELQAGLADYVKQGGGLLMLGGYYAFGDEYRGTQLDEVSPVAFSPSPDRRHEPAGAAVTPGPQAAELGVATPMPDTGRAYWLHEVTAKPEARVFLTSGGRPLLVGGACGRGRVAVFAGSVMGEPVEGQTPFWEAPGWPALLAGTVAWLTPPSARRPPDPPQALLAAAVAQIGDLERDAADRLFAAVVFRVGEAEAGSAESLLASGQTEKAILGLRLLGLTRARDARERLLTILDKGGEGVPRQTGQGAEAELEGLMSETAPDVAGDMPEPILADPGTVKAQAERDRRLRLAALDGLGWLGDAAVLPALRGRIAEFRPKPLAPGQFRENFTADDEMFQTALLAALRCGDEAAAGEAIDALLGNLYTLAAVRIAILAETKDPQAIKRKDLYRQAAARLTEFQGQAVERLRLLPEALFVPLARRLAAEPDRWVTPLAFAVFGPAFNAGRMAPASARDILRTATVPAVADLGGTP
ncbi:MAG: hypothetical protein BWZ02_00807 [Lentisphaerae bacterium ADurb.BinA184]|nr:MAG: hypothetical protein BWZ02_00807 [Lentisphaerae bacterium ADurb.BinA184]